MKQKWYTLGSNEVLKILETSQKGLSPREARVRLLKYGYNEIEEIAKITPFQILISQFKGVFTIILFVATIISLLLGEILDAVVIFIILIINAVLGFIQEYRAEKAIEALKKLVHATAIVRRNDEEVEIDARELVPGDIILLKEGDKVQADCRLIDVTSLLVDESALTGESVTIPKYTQAISDAPIHERKNMVFMGTLVTYGRAEGVVVGTGMKTEIGNIAELIQKKEEETTFQVKLNRLAKLLGTAVVILSLFVFIIGIFNGKDIPTMFLTSLALAVSAIPEGLPAVVTITLALGVSKMAKRNALVRKLTVVETLGSATVICADKTGTMTSNEMTVTKIWCNGRFVEVSGVGFGLQGDFYFKKKKINPKGDRHLSTLLEIGKYCNNAKVIKLPNSEVRVNGDPTEIALLIAAEKAGIEEIGKRIREIPFSSERSMMTTVYKTKKGSFAYVKGSSEMILAKSTSIYKNNRIRRLNKQDRKKITSITNQMAKSGLRVLALAYKRVSGKESEEELEKDLIFVGLVGMIDPPRKEVKKAIQICKEAGIKVVMITGDHKLTAVEIAKQLDILDKSNLVLTGEELEKISDEKLDEIVEDVAVYARTSPKQKMRILSAWKKRGHIVAMTGDGVNDAPAIKSADIGIAMGIKGTDVAKEVSDIILTDDNFATIVDAVEEGRGIFDNIRKFVRFLLSANFDELILISIAVLLGLPLPLLPLQILWINLVTDGLPALALSVDPKTSGIMKRKPLNPKKGLLSGMWLFILVAALVAVASSLTLFIWELNTSGDVTKARTMAFTVAIMFELFFVFNCRSENKSAFRTNILSNKKLVYAVILSILLQLMVIYVPFFQSIFDTVALDLTAWVKVIALSITGLFVFPEIFMNREIRFRRDETSHNIA